MSNLLPPYCRFLLSPYFYRLFKRFDCCLIHVCRSIYHDVSINDRLFQLIQLRADILRKHLLIMCILYECHATFLETISLFGTIFQLTEHILLDCQIQGLSDVLQSRGRNIVCIVRKQSCLIRIYAKCILSFILCRLDLSKSCISSNIKSDVSTALVL